MKSLLAKAAALGVTPETALPDGLSPREAEILELVAGGLTTARSARRRLHQQAPAANHIRNICARPSPPTAPEAASYAHRHGLAGGADDAALGFAACRCS